MCERTAKKDAPAAVFSRAACVSRAPPADASRPALSGWGRPAWSLRVKLFAPFLGGLDTLNMLLVGVNYRLEIYEKNLFCPPDPINNVWFLTGKIHLKKAFCLSFSTNI